MSEAPLRFIPNEIRTSIIKITSYEGKNVAGFLMNACYDGKRSFANLMQLLLLIEKALDTLNFPQRGTEMRIFDETAEDKEYLWSLPYSQGVGAALATFEISILFRQNASWQGRIIWQDRQVESQFRSALELIGLLDSALTAATESGRDPYPGAQT